MKSYARRMMLVGLAVLIALPLAAAQKEAQEKEKKKKGGSGPIESLKKELEAVGLTAEQKKKVEDIVTEHQPKIAAAVKKAGDAPKLIAEARKRLKEEGKKGKELNQGSIDAAKLTAEQKAGYDELQSATAAFRSAVAAVLTDEQKEKAGLTKKKGKKNN